MYILQIFYNLAANRLATINGFQSSLTPGANKNKISKKRMEGNTECLKEEIQVILKITGSGKIFPLFLFSFPNVLRAGAIYYNT